MGLPEEIEQHYPWCVFRVAHEREQMSRDKQQEKINQLISVNWDLQNNDVPDPPNSQGIEPAGDN